MDLPSLIGRAAGAAPVRAAVNSGFHAYARLRMRALDRLDPVAVQEGTLRALVRTCCRIPRSAGSSGRTAPSASG